MYFVGDHITYFSFSLSLPGFSTNIKISQSFPLDFDNFSNSLSFSCFPGLWPPCINAKRIFVRGMTRVWGSCQRGLALLGGLSPPHRHSLCVDTQARHEKLCYRLKSKDTWMRSEPVYNRFLHLTYLISIPNYQTIITATTLNDSAWVGMAEIWELFAVIPCAPQTLKR